MSNRTKLFFLGLLYACSVVYAEESSPIFLSLTRKAESLNELPTNTSIINSAKISENNPRNLGEILLNEVSLSNGKYGTLGATTNIMIRGSASEQVLVLIDGRRINDPAMGIVDTGSIPVESIERIEIIRGGASAIYGTSAFGGIINIITKKPQEETASVDLGALADSLNTRLYRMNFSIKKDKTSSLLSAVRTFSDGWRENSAYDNNSIFTRIGYNDKYLGDFDFSGTFFRSNAGIPGIGVSLDQYDGIIEKKASTPDAVQKENNAYSRLEHSKKLDLGSLKTIVYVSKNDTNYNVPSSPKNDDYKSFVFGSEIQFTALRGTTLGGEWWRETHTNYDNINSITKIDKSRINSALYAQQEWKIKKLILFPSIRFDDNSGFGSVFSPRITLTYLANDIIKLSSNVSKAWRSPTFNELYWPTDVYVSMIDGTTYVTQGNPSLKPEEGVTSDIGVEYTKSSYKAKTTIFITESNNLINWNETSNLATKTVTTVTENIGKTRQQGIEFEFSQKLFSGIYHQLNYTYLNAENTENNTKLSYRPSHTLNYEISYMTQWNMKINTNIQYVGSQKTGDTYAPIVDELPEYTLLGMKISQNISNVEFWLKVDNITDKCYQTRLEYPLPGRIFAGGITIKFGR